MIPGSTFESHLLELAIAIGANTGGELLQYSMPLFIEKLNCNGTMVIRCTEKDAHEVSVVGVSEMDQNLLVPKAPALYGELSVDKPYLTFDGESEKYHVFLLVEYGILAMQFCEIPDEQYIQKLLPVIDTLANACNVSEQLVVLHSENEKYTHESRLLHAVIENIPDPIFVKDKDGRKIILNQAEADILGVKKSEVIGKNDFEFYQQDVALKTANEDRMIIETGKPLIHREGILTTKNGKEIWIQGTKIPHFDENGKVSGIIGISHNISAFKTIENELRVVAEKYRSIFDSFVDLYYRSDMNGTILDLSPSVYQLSGYMPEELIGKSVAEVYVDMESRHRMVKTLLEKGSVNDFENLLIHKSGMLIPVSITCHLIKDFEGIPGYIEGTIRDITERKETEKKLNKLYNLQNLLTHLATEFINIPIENSREAINRLLAVIGKGNEIDGVNVCEYDFVKNTMSVTHQWFAGCTSEESDNLPQIPLDRIPMWIETHKKGEMLIEQNLTNLADNSALYNMFGQHGIKSLVTLPLILNGECLGFVGFNSADSSKVWSPEEITFLKVLADLLCNITDRKKTDEALRNREASLKAIFNNVPFQMWLKDVDSKYLAVNEPFMDYFSIISEDEIIGKNALDIWDSEVGQHFIDQDNLVMEDRTLRSVEELVDFKHKSVWFEIFRAPILDPDGNLLGTTGIARDITHRKNADKALQQAVAKAEAANEAKSKFLAIMSHEIRNPLSAVVGMVRMLHEAGNKGPNSKLIDNIKISSDHLLMIINDILDFSKIESGEMILEETSFNIHDVVKRVFNSHVFIAKEQLIDLKYHVDKRISNSHMGDPLRLQQVLSNLTNNALKFTPKGSIEIRCEFESESLLSTRVRFEVEDTGVGISAENQERIFESFKQENDAISRTHGGTGLGLAISKQIVELMGGKLCIESKKNVGSKFFFSVEFKNDDSIEVQVPEEVKVVELDSLKGCSVLLVEDNVLNQILATIMLEKWGTKVVVADNGQHALDILEERSFDIILMDLQMPVMDGMTASKNIREKLHLTTPILALSANVIKGIVEKCEEAGMQGYISKPFEPEDLYKKIISHVSKNRSFTENKVEEDPDIVIADISRLVNMIGSDQMQLNRMLNKFLEITPAYLVELNAANTANDIKVVASASHKIKSSIDLVSTQIMRDLILKISVDSKNGNDLNEIKPLITKFNTYYKLLEKELKVEIHTLKTVLQ